MRRIGEIAAEAPAAILRARARDILAKLRMVSYVRASAPDAIRVSEDKAEDTILHGQGGCVVEDFNLECRRGCNSLHEHYTEAFNRADDRMLEPLLDQAEFLYARLMKGPTLGTIHRMQRNEASDVAQILKYGEGVSSESLALQMELPIGWIETLRRKNRQDPKTGTPQEGFLGMSDEDRFKEVQKLRYRGMSQAKAALHLKVGKPTVQRYWSQERRAA